MTTLDAMRGFAQRAKAASRVMANATTAQKNQALTALANELRTRTASIVEANALDLADAKTAGKNAAFIDRLLLDPARIEAMAKAVEFIVTLEDPIGEVTETWRQPNGLEVRKVRLPGILDQIADQAQAPVVLDNLEILFDKDLQQDPLRLLQSISRNRAVVASWNGIMNSGRLLYAETGHPEYRSYDSVDALIVGMDGTATVDSAKNNREAGQA